MTARGEVWEAAAALPFRLLVVQHDALAGAPTVVGVAVTDRPQRAPEPLAIPLGGALDGWWVKTTQVHTLPAEDLRRRVGTLDAEAMAAVDAALARVLALAR